MNKQSWLHPSEEELIRYLDEDPAVLEFVSTHLDECDICLNRIQIINGFRTSITSIIRDGLSTRARMVSLLARADSDHEMGEAVDEIIRENSTDLNEQAIRSKEKLP
jgi:hypothetical protein